MTRSSAGSVPLLPAGSRLETGLAAAGSLRWVAVDLREALEEARRRLDLSPVPAVALGRTLTAAVLLLRIALKTPTRLLVEVRGEGPLGRIVGEADSEGGVRGMVSRPRLAAPTEGPIRIAPLLGRGFLRVTRLGERHRYSSEVELVSGELGDDITHFLQQSEQIRSAVLLGVLPKPLGIAAAGGLIVEALPGTDDEAIRRLEGNIRGLAGVSAALERGGASRLAAEILEGLDPEILEARPLAYRCRCSRERLLERLRPLAARRLEDLLGDDGSCEAVCAFCGERYEYAPEELVTAD